jgi:hypothetical protein
MKNVVAMMAKNGSQLLANRLIRHWQPAAGKI